VFKPIGLKVMKKSHVAKGVQFSGLLKHPLLWPQPSKDKIAVLANNTGRKIWQK